MVTRRLKLGAFFGGGLPNNRLKWRNFQGERPWGKRKKSMRLLQLAALAAVAMTASASAATISCGLYSAGETGTSVACPGVSAPIGQVIGTWQLLGLPGLPPQGSWATTYTVVGGPVNAATAVFTTTPGTCVPGCPGPIGGLVLNPGIGTPGFTVNIDAPFGASGELAISTSFTAAPTNGGGDEVPGQGVPEPRTWALAGLGLVALVGYRLRRR